MSKDACLSTLLVIANIILKNKNKMYISQYWIFNCSYYGEVNGQSTVWLPTFFKISSFVQQKKFIQFLEQL